ncbi:hypothetical protein BHM03_00041703 [Ensete ventricosum]|nr:hypothetical protein BHM03_00041703 [Ensete ventricosum]
MLPPPPPPVAVFFSWERDSVVARGKRIHEGGVGTPAEPSSAARATGSRCGSRALLARASSSSIARRSAAAKGQAGDMGEEEKKKKPKHKDQKSQPQKPPRRDKSATGDPHFKPSADVKGIRFGGQFVVKSFTVRQAAPLELLRLLDIPPSCLSQCQSLPFPSITTYLPTNFTILAHHAWHTLTLGLGTKKSKAVIFVFESESMKVAVDRLWPRMIPLGDVNKRLIRGLAGCEMSRFKFRKGCLTFYVYAVRRLGAAGFSCADDLRRILEAVVALKDFLDHTAMLALASQRSIAFPNPVAMAH